jgi:hypothetical protein
MEIWFNLYLVKTGGLRTDLKFASLNVLPVDTKTHAKRVIPASIAYIFIYPLNFVSSIFHTGASKVHCSFDIRQQISRIQRLVASVGIVPVN